MLTQKILGEFFGPQRGGIIRTKKRQKWRCFLFLFCFTRDNQIRFGLLYIKIPLHKNWCYCKICVSMGVPLMGCQNLYQIVVHIMNVKYSNLRVGGLLNILNKAHNFLFELFWTSNRLKFGGFFIAQRAIKKGGVFETIFEIFTNCILCIGRVRPRIRRWRVPKFIRPQYASFYQWNCCKSLW